MFVTQLFMGKMSAQKKPILGIESRAVLQLLRGGSPAILLDYAIKYTVAVQPSGGSVVEAFLTRRAIISALTDFAAGVITRLGEPEASMDKDNDALFSKMCLVCADFPAMEHSDWAARVWAEDVVATFKLPLFKPPAFVTLVDSSSNKVFTGDLTADVDAAGFDIEKTGLCLDFDGVIHSYDSGWKGADVITDLPVPGSIEFLMGWVEKASIKIYSARSAQRGGIKAMRGYIHRAIRDYYFSALSDNTDHSSVPELLSTAEIIAAVLVMRLEFPKTKPKGVPTIDDRFIEITDCSSASNWPTVDCIKGFKPWNKRPV